MKETISTLLVFLVVQTTFSQSYNPNWHDKAKLGQYKAMENGPWEFKESLLIRGWYNVFYPKYKRNYQPSTINRNFIQVQKKLENDKSQEERDTIKNWRFREMTDFLDRHTDITYPLVEKKFQNVEKRIDKSIRNFIQIAGYYKTAGNIIEEYGRLKENKKIIQKSNMENEKKQEAYLNLLNELDNLNATIVAFMKIGYHTRINQHFIKKN